MVDRLQQHNQIAMLLAIREVYTSAYLITLNIIFFITYYSLTYLLITYSNLGIFLVSAPFELVILMILSASITLTIAIARIDLARRRPSVLGAASSVGSFAIGSITLTCTCNAPIISTILYLIGFNSLLVSSLLTVLIKLQIYIIIALVLINIANSIYMLNRIGSQIKIKAG